MQWLQSASSNSARDLCGVRASTFEPLPLIAPPRVSEARAGASGSRPASAASAAFSRAPGSQADSSGLSACRRTLKARAWQQALAASASHEACPGITALSRQLGRGTVLLALGGSLAPLRLSGQQTHWRCLLHVVKERRTHWHGHDSFAGGARALHGCRLEAVPTLQLQSTRAATWLVRMSSERARSMAGRLKTALICRVPTGGLAGPMPCHSAEDTGALAAQRSTPRVPDSADALVVAPTLGRGPCMRAPRGLLRKAHSQAAQHGAPERLRVLAGRRMEQRQVARRVAGAPARPGLGALAGAGSKSARRSAPQCCWHRQGVLRAWD